MIKPALEPKNPRLNLKNLKKVHNLGLFIDDFWWFWVFSKAKQKLNQNKKPQKFHNFLCQFYSKKFIGIFCIYVSNA